MDVIAEPWPRKRRRTSPRTPARAAEPAAARTPRAEDARTRAEAREAAPAPRQSLRQAMQDMPELAELSKQIIIDQTPEGLRIQLVDQEGRSMFEQGSAEPNDRAKMLLRAVAKIAQHAAQPHHHRRPHQRQRRRRQAAGRLGSCPSARADAARQILQAAGVDPDRIYQVAGKAGSDPLLSGRPAAAGQSPHRHRAAAGSAACCRRTRACSHAVASPRRARRLRQGRGLPLICVLTLIWKAPAFRDTALSDPPAAVLSDGAVALPLSAGARGAEGVRPPAAARRRGAQRRPDPGRLPPVARTSPTARPASGCDACVSARIPVADYAFSRSEAAGADAQRPTLRAIWSRPRRRWSSSSCCAAT